jgi:hypothetical protein
MKVGLRATKQGTLLYEGVHNIIDQDTFAAAFADMWREIRQRQLEATTSVGQLMENLNDEVLDELSGAEIKLSKIA